MSEGRPFVRAQFSSDFTKMLETLLIDEPHPAPEWVKENLWIPFDKEFSLSNLSSSDVKSILHSLEAAKAAIILMLPPRSVDWQLLSQFEEVWAKAVAKLARSKEGFERKQLTTSRIIQTPKPEEEEKKKRGWF